MLRTKLFMGFALVIIIFAMLSAFLGIQTIKHNVMAEAQNHVRLDLSSAWAVIGNRLEKLETILSLLSSKEIIVESCDVEDWDNEQLLHRLEKVRRNFDLDFLSLVSPKGSVVIRATAPFNKGDYRDTDPVISRALAGEALSAIALMSQAELEREAEGLAERAFLELDDTTRARKTTKTIENRGMVMIAAQPVRKADKIVGVIYGGVLVNRNHELIDWIHDVVYRNETYKDTPLGTATIFLHDIRIATTVCLKDGNRALGTRVSKKVADQVLDNGAPWVGEAFVVRDWYLTAYDPIRDINGRIIGMLYVGILRQPFLDSGYAIMVRYIWLSIFALLGGLVVAFVLANRLSQPIHRLVEATHRMSNGDASIPVSSAAACRETDELIKAFNNMLKTLAEREENLKATNRNYMETLGFVTHELKSPIGSILNYLYLMRQHKLGPLTEKQEKAMRICGRSVDHVAEMIRHYLNLSRIENNEMEPHRTTVTVSRDILKPLLEDMEIVIQESELRIQNLVEPEITVEADANMLREVFENLLSNAVKYGKKNGLLSLKARAIDGVVEFEVRNDGPGIPREKLEKLFRKFSRVNNGGSKEKGTGLGLFITKYIVELHGGTIRAESEENSETAFIFTLPKYNAGRNSSEAETT
ncbi:MAG: cache domain-containing protein [Lentisphaerae bacterium]|nr:cache domain-containing protein [Lentisphaerota bacterium]